MSAPSAPVTVPAAPTAPFGSVFGDTMAVSRFDGSQWSPAALESALEITVHPGTHALHYGSACFEGLKAHRQADGSVRAFRANAHAARLSRSAARLWLPVPPPELTEQLIEMATAANADVTPATPGSLYLRPTLLGTDVTIGAAAHPSLTAILFVLACPVGEYLPPHRLVIAVESETPRTTPQFGSVKAGANYAMALTPIMAAKAAHGADQVLFAPGRIVQETGASNIIVIDTAEDGTVTVTTPALTDAYLHGVTRDSLLRLAASLGWNVVETEELTLDQLRTLVATPNAEIALTGTAAIVAPVGTLVIGGERVEVGRTGTSPRTTELRDALVAIQTGHATFDW